jgi:hypothetical protein
MEAKMFPLRDVLSIVFNIGLCKSKLDLVAIFEYMLNTTLYEVQCQQAATICHKEILLQHPQLDIKKPDVPIPPDQVNLLVSNWENMFGKEIEIKRMPKGTFKLDGPVARYSGLHDITHFINNN